jgi:prepilin-type N-terminal cleavage/methylation domain-containing protein
MATASRRFLLVGGGRDQGFTLIELLIVMLIVGILAAVATPLYLGYIRDAKTVEAKVVAGSLWTAVQSIAIGSCGSAVTVANAYPKAGLGPGGITTPARWSVTPGGDVTVDCSTGAILPDQTVFTVNGTSPDVSFIQVRLVYGAASNPPSHLQCSTDSGVTFVDC